MIEKDCERDIDRMLAHKCCLKDIIIIIMAGINVINDIINPVNPPLRPPNDVKKKIKI